MSLYALISALEEDLRFTIKEHISDPLLINKELLERARTRIEKDYDVIYDELNIDDLVDYFDIGDTFQTINANKKYFPEHISKLIKSLTKEFQQIISIRNRVMHIRPLNYDDLPYVNLFCAKLIGDKQQNSPWVNLQETLKNLKDDPGSVLSLEIASYEDENSISNNLPFPDFDETGLIGRDDDIKNIKKLCLGNFPVISIVGEGGIGKTALALKVAYELIEKNSSPYDAVVWVTSKTTQITVSEIKEIKGAITNSLDVIQSISNEIVGKNTNTGFDEIIEYLEEFKIALFIDNLETILDENIKSFVSSLPEGSKIIITSRIGLGAYEFPVKLKGIEESYASQLLRSLSKLRKVDSLSKLNESTLKRYVNRMHLNPSYIKWFVSSVQTGLNPEDVLQNSGMFLDFCMSNVYKFLSKNTKQLTTTFQCAPGFKDLPELAELTQFKSTDLKKAIQELMTTNMLNQSSTAIGGSVKTTYQLSDLSRAYLSKYHKPTPQFQNKIRGKLNKLNSIYEQQMHQKHRNRYHPRSIESRGRSDRVIVKMLLDSQKYISNNNFEMAYEVLEEARNLSPDFFEVARFMAYYHQKSNNLAEAREHYELAIELSPHSPQLYYWFGKFILMDEQNVDDAVIQFKKASSIDKESIEVSLALARGYLFQHDFSSTSNELERIKGEIDSAPERLQKMYLDTGIQIYYRKADNYAKNEMHSEAISALNSMRKTFDELEPKYKDQYLRKKLKKCGYITRSLEKNATQSELRRLKEIQKWINKESKS